MTAEQLIRREILRQAQADGEPVASNFGPLETSEQVETAYDKLIEADVNLDYEVTFRCGQVETDIPAPGSRHYESKSVAMKTADGQWIGWTYWYGGGKHGEPGAVPWMEDAYLLDVIEEQKTVTVRTFEKRADQ